MFSPPGSVPHSLNWSGDTSQINYYLYMNPLLRETQRDSGFLLFAVVTYYKVTPNKESANLNHCSKIKCRIKFLLVFYFTSINQSYMCVSV